MRHLIANIFTYAIALGLIGGAALFAWMRSAQLEIANEETVVARYDVEGAEPFPWPELGQRAYVSNCANCHGEDGEGWDQYPGLGHTAQLYAQAGSGYLIDVHLYGLTSDRYGAPMPPMGHMQDVELAAAINHVLSSFGNERAPSGDVRHLRPRDIEARRGRGLRPADVNAGRPHL